MNYLKRRRKLVQLIESKSLDALLVRKKYNISYLTGTKGEDAILFFSGKKKCEFKIRNNPDIGENLKEMCKKTRSRCIGFESNNFSYSEYTDIKKKLKNITLTPVRDLVESLRMVKDSDEISYIKKACKYASGAMDYALKNIQAQLTEWSIKTKLEAYLAKKEVRGADFDIIVASGKNASLPHAIISKKIIKKGEMVIIDLGTMNYGYNSDLTRTVFLGRIDREYLRIYNIVLDAQKKAIEHIKPGVKVGYLDNISRQYISEKGFGKYFIHGLGHGIGLEVHEKPSIFGKNRITLEENMTITIEPGIYIHGWGGVRIEDVVLVTKNGYEVLTDSRK